MSNINGTQWELTQQNSDILFAHVNYLKVITVEYIYSYACKIVLIPKSSESKQIFHVTLVIRTYVHKYKLQLQCPNRNLMIFYSKKNTYMINGKTIKFIAMQQNFEYTHT